MALAKVSSLSLILNRDLFEDCLVTNGAHESRAQSLIQRIAIEGKSQLSDGVLTDACGQLLNRLTRLSTHITPEFEPLSGNVEHRVELVLHETLDLLQAELVDTFGWILLRGEIA